MLFCQTRKWTDCGKRGMRFLAVLTSMRFSYRQSGMASDNYYKLLLWEMWSVRRFSIMSSILVSWSLVEFCEIKAAYSTPWLNHWRPILKFTNSNKFSKILFPAGWNIFAFPLKLSSKVLIRWLIARSLIMLGSWIRYKALIMFLNSAAKEFIGVPLTNFKFCNFICTFLLYLSPQNICSNSSFTWACIMLALAVLTLHKWKKAVPSRYQNKIPNFLSFSISIAFRYVIPQR